MIRKLFFLVSIALLAAVPARAASSLPVSVAFSYNDGIRVANIAADGAVTTDFIPGAYFKQGEISLIRAIWGADNHSLYYVAAPNDTPDQYRDIYAYDQTTKQKSLVASLKKASTADDYAVLNMSPSGRYLWLYRDPSASSALIDTQAPADQRVVFTLDDCLAQVVAWAENVVYVNGAFSCYGKFMAVDLSARKVIGTFNVADAGQYLEYANWRVLAGTSPALIAENEGQIYRITPSGGIEMVMPGSQLMVSDDGKTAIFWHAGAYYRITSGSVVSVMSASEPTAGFAEKNEVGYWTLKDNVLRLITFDSLGKLSKEFNAIPAGAELDAAPDDAYAALIYRGENKLQIYSTSGRTFDSGTFPAGLLQPKKPDAGESNWWKDWYFAGIDKDDVLRLAVNAVTGRRFDIPQPHTTFSGTSPDGTWWLFACISDDQPTSPCGAADKLIAVNAQSGQTVVLSDDTSLDQRNFHFAPYMYYAWLRN